MHLAKGVTAEDVAAVEGKTLDKNDSDRNNLSYDAKCFKGVIEPLE